MENAILNVFVFFVNDIMSFTISQVQGLQKRIDF